MTDPSIWRTPPGEKPEGDLVDQLTDYGREQMLRQLATAVGTHCPLDQAESHEHPAAVIEAYRRTAIVRADPDFGKPETERPLWDYRRGDTGCPCDFIEWFPDAKFRSGVDGQLKMGGWCPTCWLGCFVTLGELRGEEGA